ncbi:hypothetical protein [Salinisphaera sp. G21_0]|uniref:hypothetical protein n=1 Tax=Salinisphaera sp. G21_0 TaxID=2821094 RepID=UPI001ADD1443|nr:hypothetical protein [Salinisphaera sp. G21_0]MBO9483124.1 hypothetical protein [Salinisphaera sp. G21_0]
MRHIHPDYDQLRAVGKDLNSALFKELTQDEYKIVARRLETIKKGKMRFDSYEQFDQYTDFCINDYVDSRGENLVKRYKRRHHETISATEARIIDALLTSQTSLFQILSRDTDSATVQLKDLLNGGELAITDRNLSASPGATSFIMFTRILTYGDDLHITSGASMLFPNHSREQVLLEYWRLLKKSPAGSIQSKRYAAFYKLHSKHGFKDMARDEEATVA